MLQTRFCWKLWRVASLRAGGPEGQRIYVGNWKTFIRDVVEEMKKDGVQQLKAILHGSAELP
jgi:hypothetical protein